MQKNKVLISIQPKWVAKILNHTKLTEIRHTIPKCSFPVEVYIYCTKGGFYNSLIQDKTGSYLEVTKDVASWYNINDLFNSGYNGKVVAKFTLKFYDDYSCWVDSYASLLKHIDHYAGTDGNLSFIDAYLKGQKRGYSWNITDLVVFNKPKPLSAYNLTRAPQSWCYLKEN